MSPRAERLLAAAAILVCLVAFGWARVTVYDPGLLPGWDGSNYVLRGVRVHDAIVDRDLAELGNLLVRPDIRPPGFALLLGLFMLPLGPTVATTVLWNQLAFLASLALLPVLGHRVAGAAGRQAGWAAMALTGVGLEHLSLILVPMSESTSLLTMVLGTLVLVTCAPRPGVRAALAVGFAILGAGLIRYNLPLLLLAPLAAWWLTEQARDLRRTWWRPLVWLAPLVATFGAWQLAQPRLSGRIETFMVNRSSGLDFWSVENLLFVPLASARGFVGWPATVLLLAAGGVAAVALVLHLAPRVAPGLAERWSTTPAWRILAWQAAAAVGALTAHDYKIDRNLSNSAPLWALAALAAPVPGWVRGAALGAAGWQLVAGLHTLPERYRFTADPQVEEALDFLVDVASKSPRLWVTGTNDILSPPLIELWLRGHDVDVVLDTRAEALGEVTRLGKDAAWSDAYQQAVDTEYLAPKLVDRTTYVTIETIPGTRRYRAGQRWTNFQNNYARAFVRQDVVPLVAELRLEDAGILLRAWRAGGPALPKPEETPLPEATSAPGGAPAPVVAEWTDGTWNADFSTFTLTGAGTATAEGLLTIPVPVSRMAWCGPLVPAVPSARVTVALANRADGRTLFQLRALDADGKPMKLDGGGALIHRVGPFAPGATKEAALSITAAPGEVTWKPCLVLDGLTGEIVVEKVELRATPAGGE